MHDFKQFTLQHCDAIVGGDIVPTRGSGDPGDDYYDTDSGRLIFIVR